MWGLMDVNNSVSIPMDLTSVLVELATDLLLMDTVVMVSNTFVYIIIRYTTNVERVTSHA